MTLNFYKGTKKENPDSTVWDNLICLITSSRFSHVELAFEQQGTWYRCWSSSARDKGVREKWIDTSSGRWVVIPITDVATEELFKQETDAKYDFIGLAGTVIPIKYFSSKTKWFCSEIIAEALSIKASWSISPEKLYKRYTKA
jgi:hypothetical protein